MPVLIRRPNGANLGSGFFLTDDKAIYLVTAKHVLFDRSGDRLKSPQLNLLSYPRDPKELGKNSLSIHLAVLAQAGAVKVHPSEDVVVVRIASITGGEQPAEHSPDRRITPLPGVVIHQGTTRGLTCVAVESLKRYDEVLVANEVIVFGYPTSLGLKELPQLDPLRPLLRGGIVAGQNPATQSLVIDAPIYQGNSGGPVLEVVRKAFQVEFRVIGIIREFVPYEEQWENKRHGYVNKSWTNSGYAIATPMDFVLELIK